MNANNILQVGLGLLFILFLSSCEQTTDEKEQNKQHGHTEKMINLTISAAISLSDALEEIKEIYERENDVIVTFNFGGSGTLAQQIQRGAPVDIFISAHQEWMDTLEEKNLILSETRANITGNAIVLIAKKTSNVNYSSFSDIDPQHVQRIAIGHPDSVPAGKYAQQALQHAKVWDKIKNQVVLAKDARQVLTYVETGNADLGFVYESDTHNSENIQIITRANKSNYEQIIYPAAVTQTTKHKDAAQHFITFMESDKAQHILKSHGFEK
ncbi:MAG TPA: molybdate ABC transporter substrate-binding protein [Bacillota bacterium]